MKKLFTFLLTALLAIGVGWATEKSESTTISSVKADGSEVKWSNDKLTFSFTTTPTTTSYSNETNENNGARGLGTGAKNGTHVLTSAQSFKNVTKVEITGSTNDTGNKLSVTVGGTAIGSETTMSKGDKNKVFEFKAGTTKPSGTIAITINNTSKTVWIKTITVYYEEEETQTFGPISITPASGTTFDDKLTVNISVPGAAYFLVYNNDDDDILPVGPYESGYYETNAASFEIEKTTSLYVTAYDSKANGAKELKSDVFTYTKNGEETTTVGKPTITFGEWKEGDTQVKFTITNGTNGTATEYSINNGTETTYSGEVTVDLTEVASPVKVDAYSYDDDSNMSEVASQTFTLPALGVTITPNAYTGTEAQTISLAASNYVSEPLITYSINGGDQIDYEAPFTLSEPGTYQIEASVLDERKGGDEVTATATITITAPAEPSSDPVVLFHETFGDNEKSARDWSNTYSVKSGIETVYNNASYTVTDAKQSKNSMGSTASALVSGSGKTGVFIVGPLSVADYEQLKVTNKFGMSSGTWAASSYMKLSYSVDGTTYTEVTRSGSNPSGAVSSGKIYADASYTLPTAAEVNSLYLKFEFYCYQVNKNNQEIGQVYFDEPELQGVKKAAPVATKYPIAITQHEHGTITTDPTEAAEGETVNFKIVVEEGYKVSSWDIYWMAPASASSSRLKGEGEGVKTKIQADVTTADGQIAEGSFIMPAGEVTVDINFAEKSDTEPATGINSVNAEGKAVKAVRVYNVNGAQLREAQTGVNIIVTEYMDGTTSTRKAIKNF